MRFERFADGEDEEGSSCGLASKERACGRSRAWQEGSVNPLQRACCWQQGCMLWRKKRRRRRRSQGGLVRWKSAGKHQGKRGCPLFLGRKSTSRPSAIAGPPTSASLYPGRPLCRPGSSTVFLIFPHTDACKTQTSQRPTLRLDGPRACRTTLDLAPA